jgi:DMSO/TMAO reductase YedYZ molybdopterin-dependent catalytic subunit
VSLIRRETLITGLCTGAIALGLNYLGVWLVGVPLLPEQAGNILIKVLPLAAFEGLLHTFGVLARPLLLVGASLVIILVFGAAALLVDRVSRRGQSLILGLAAALVTAAIGLIAASPADSVISLLIEVLIYAGSTLAVYAARQEYTSTTGVSSDRRLLMRNLFYGAVGVALLGVAYADVRRLVTALAVKEGSRALQEITPVSDFYVVSKNLVGDPAVDAGSWRLNLPTRSISYAELLGLPAHRLELTLECISNDVGGTLISNGAWSGPRVQDVLGLTTVPTDARYMLIESADGYTESFLLIELTPDHLLATHLNDQPLTAAHGFPARFIFPGHYGMKQPKWVTKVRFSSTDKPGYWENNGWDERAVVKTMSRIDAPADKALVSSGRVTFSGIAFAGARRISRVQLTWAGNGEWHDATLADEFSPYAWRFWQLDASLAAGHYLVSVRALDGEGNWQTSTPTSTLPNGADGLHSVGIDVR